MPEGLCHAIAEAPTSTTFRRHRRFSPLRDRVLAPKIGGLTSRRWMEHLKRTMNSPTLWQLLHRQQLESLG